MQNVSQLYVLFLLNIFYIFYAWCVYSLLSNQFFVIPICLVTFFFLFFHPLDSSEKYKTFPSFSWFQIHLTTRSSSHTSFTFFNVRFLIQKHSQVLWLCSGTFWWEFSILLCTSHVLTITSTFLLLLSWSIQCYMLKMKSQRINILKWLKLKLMGLCWKV